MIACLGGAYCVRYAVTGSPRCIAWGAFLCGLALCNQHTIVLFEAPAIAWIVWTQYRSGVRCLWAHKPRVVVVPHSPAGCPGADGGETEELGWPVLLGVGAVPVLAHRTQPEPAAWRLGEPVLSVWVLAPHHPGWCVLLCFRAVPCCAVLCCAVLCCAVLCWCGVAAGCGCEGVRVSLYLSLWLLCLCMCLCVHVAVPVPVPVPVLPWALTHTSACWAP